YINYTNNIISNININDKTDIIDIIKEIQQKIIYYADKINDIKIESFCPTIKKLNSDCVEIFETIEKLYHTNETKFVLSDRRASSHDDFICKKSPHIVVEKAEFKILEKVLENDNNLFFNLFKIVFQGLSSGQQALLDMFSKFYDIKDKIETNSILVIMDEPELYFHPEWQRQLIYYFIDFFSKYFNNKSIQLIISSNSPYILSDLRMENVILLENNKESKVDNTFGNNIHYLLKDKYFMEFTIGEFSKQKIENALKIINRNKKIDIEKYNELDKIIDSVGDELLRYKLKCMLEEKKYD
ncbi:MAG: AAA family ATPase, partial [Clostridia bacterium]